MTAYKLGIKIPTYPSSGNYWYAPNASIIGDVVFSENASVWFNAVLRGDNEPLVIGENSNIQDGAVLHTDMGCPLIIGKDCTIGHMAMLHGCIIDDNTLIGMGAIILNNAKIGKNCIIGANALITEGKIIPDNSLVIGAPGKVIRATTEEEIINIKKSASNYVNNWMRYKKDLVILDN